MTIEDICKIATSCAPVVSLSATGCDPPERVGTAGPLDEAAAALISDMVDAGCSRDDLEVTEDGKIIVQGDGVIDTDAYRAHTRMGFRQYHTTETVHLKIRKVYLHIAPGIM